MGDSRARARQKGVQSIDIAGRLLEVFLQEDRPMMLRDLAAAADLGTAQALAYLHSLKRLGLVRQVAQSARYELAEGCLELAGSVLHQDPEQERLIIAAQQLSDETGEMVTLDRPVGTEVVTVHVSQGRQRLAIDTRAGQVNDDANSASAQILGGRGGAEGVLHCAGLPVPHMSSLAMGVPGPDGLPVAALTVIGRPEQVTGDPRSPLLLALRQAVRALQDGGGA